MRRLIACLLPLLATAPAPAWEARIGTVCELTHAEAGGEVRVTYDPRVAEYAITIRRAAGAWPEGPIFVIRFNGGRALTIQTDRHALSEGGAALTVTDRGFGNVLDGLQFNETATAYLGDIALPFALTGPEPAAPAVDEFRRCTEGGLV
ncbi:MAG: excinuclease ABC subunit B [Paracoccaceae bacterium]|jgi:hypothetical protein|nr:excinuclease ABC subunit B [Paracoccaceae bacterium]